MSGYRKPRRSDWKKTFVFIAIYLAILVISAIYLLVSYWYVWIVLAAVGLFITISWHAKSTAYHCPRCGYEFEISVVTDFLSPHGATKDGGWKYMKCPNCQQWSRMEILFKKKQED